MDKKKVLSVGVELLNKAFVTKKVISIAPHPSGVMPLDDYLTSVLTSSIQIIESCCDTIEELENVLTEAFAENEKATKDIFKHGSYETLGLDVLFDKKKELIRNIVAKFEAIKKCEVENV